MTKLQRMIFCIVISCASNLGFSTSPEEAGESRVLQAISLADKISLVAGISPIGVFLKRIAKVESAYGRAPGTYRPGYHGGIWQVDRVAYEATKDLRSHPGLRRLHRAISLTLNGLDWLGTTWEDCRDPVYSCLAARLYLAAIPEAVPSSLEDQAAYWKKYYNTEAGKGTEEAFIQANP